MTKKFLFSAFICLTLAMSIWAGGRQSTESVAAEASAKGIAFDGSGKTFGTLTKPVSLRWISIGPGGLDYSDIAALAAFFGQSGMLPLGSDVSHETISSGNSGSGYTIEADMGDVARGTNAVSGTRGFNGRPPYQEIRVLLSCAATNCALQVLSPGFMQKTGYTSIEQAIENKYPAVIVTQQQGSSDYLVLSMIFESYGLTLDEFQAWGGRIVATDTTTGIEMFQDGTADIWVQHTSLASPQITELLMNDKSILVNTFGEKVIDYFVRNGFARREVSQGTFGQFANGGSTFFQGVSLIASTRMSDDTAYNLTRMILENKDELENTVSILRGIDFKTATDKNIAVVPFHPGSIAYFKDIGVLDANGNYIKEPAPVTR